MLEEWLDTIPLPYTMKKKEVIKEKLFFDEYPPDLPKERETDIQEDINDPEK